MKIQIPKRQAGQSGDDGAMLRNIELKIRINNKELKAIESKMTKSKCKTLAKYCRDILLQNDSVSKTQTFNQTTEILYSLSKIGNNINQIAKRLNIDKNSYSDLASDLKNEIEELKRLQKKYK